MDSAGRRSPPEGQPLCTRFSLPLNIDAVPAPPFFFPPPSPSPQNDYAVPSWKHGTKTSPTETLIMRALGLGAAAEAIKRKSLAVLDFTPGGGGGGPGVPASPSGETGSSSPDPHRRGESRLPAIDDEPAWRREAMARQAASAATPRPSLPWPTTPGGSLVGASSRGGGGGAAPQDYGRDTGDASSSYEDAAATVEARRLEEARLRNWRSRVYLPGDAHRRSAGAADAGGAVAEVEARALELLEARRQLNLQARTRGGGSLPP